MAEDPKPGDASGVQPAAQPTQLATGTETTTPRAPDDCECHTPPKKLWPRPDLGGTIGTMARFALCVLQTPKARVHEWVAAEGRYKERPDWSVSSDQKSVLGADGKPIPVSDAAQQPQREPTAEDAFTVQDEDTGQTGPRGPRRGPGGRQGPATGGQGVNLEDNEFY